VAPNTHIFPATFDHAALLAPLMRQQDVVEVFAEVGLTPFEALANSIERSDKAFSLLIGDEVGAIWGVLGHEQLQGVGIPWLLTGRAIAKHPRVLLRHSRWGLEQMLELYPLLMTWIDARYRGALRWAEWLGFSIHPVEPIGPHGMPFHRVFYKRG
jgi:hypothetical protein